MQLRPIDKNRQSWLSFGWCRLPKYLFCGVIFYSAIRHHKVILHSAVRHLKSHMTLTEKTEKLCLPAQPLSPPHKSQSIPESQDSQFRQRPRPSAVTGARRRMFDQRRGAKKGRIGHWFSSRPFATFRGSERCFQRIFKVQQEKFFVVLSAPSWIKKVFPTDLRGSAGEVLRGPSCPFVDQKKQLSRSSRPFVPLRGSKKQLSRSSRPFADQKSS